MSEQQQARAAVSALVRAVQSNAESRAKYQQQPTKFLESEVTVAECLERVRGLAVSPEVYSDMVEVDISSCLVSLVSHENMDISSAAVTVLVELLDPSNLTNPVARPLLDSITQHTQLINVLVDNIDRLDQQSNDDLHLFDQTLVDSFNHRSSFPNLLFFFFSRPSLKTYWM